MRKISALILLALCTQLFSGCWDKKEIEDNTFAVLLGIDKAEGKNITVTVAFPLTQTQGGGANEGMDNGSGSYSVMSVKAPTVVEALNMFSVKLSGPLALHSVKTVVISEEIAQSDMLRQVLASWRNEEIRNTANVLITGCTAAEFIEARIKDAPIDPLRQEELLLEQANGSAYYKPIGLLDLLIGIKSGSGDGVAMYGGISDEDGEEKKSSGEIKESVKEGYLPDQIPLNSENQSRISGLAVFRGAEMVGLLNSAEAQAYAMLTQSSATVILTLPDPLDSEYNIAVSILSAGKSKIRAEIKDGQPVFSIEISLKCTAESIQSGVDYNSDENYAALTAYVQRACFDKMNALITKAQKGYSADILKLGNRLAYHFSTVGEWESYGWAEKYKDAEINLNVKLNIQRTGVMLP